MKFTDFPAVNLAGVTDGEFYERAFADYLDARALDYSNLCSLCSEADQGEDGFLDILHDRIEHYGLAKKALILTDYGYIFLEDLLRRLYGQAQAEIEGRLAAFDSAISICNANGIPTERRVDINDAAENVLGQMTATVAISSGIRAATEASQPADRLALFSQSVSNTVSEDAGANLTSAIAYVRNMLTQGSSAGEIITTMYDDSNLEPVAEQNDDDPFGGDMLTSNAYSYMGASPAGPICFDDISDGLLSVGKVGASVCKSIVTGVGALLKKGVDLVCDKVEQIVVNPDDLDVLVTTKHDNTIKGLCYQREYSRSSDMDSAQHFNLYDIDANLRPADEAIRAADTDEELDALVQSFYAEYLHMANLRWQNQKRQLVEIRTWYAVYQASLVDTDIRILAYWADGIPTLTVSLHHTGNNPSVIRAFPRLNSWDVVSQHSGKIFGHGVNPLSILSAATDIASTDGLLSTGNMSELEKYQSLYTSVAFMAGTFSLLQAHWFEDLFEDTTVSTVNFGPLPNDPDAVTNAKFFSLATGLVLNGSVWEPGDVGHNMGSQTILDGAEAIFSNLAVQFLERAIIPNDWGFVAYVNSGISSPTPRFRVKTDAENQEAFQTFAKTVIIVAVVVAATVAIGIGAKQLRRAMAQRRERTIAMSQSKLWSGENLTDAEWKAYRRATKKGGISSLFDKTLPSGVPDPKNSSDDSGRILQLIRG